MSPGAVFLTLVCAMFPTLILVALAVKLREVREAGRWPETTGKVIASRVRSRRNEPDDPDYNFSDTEVTNEPFVEYEYRVGDREYRCSRVTIGEKTSGEELEAILARYPVGTPVTVYYDPAKPTRAVLERTLPMGTMAAGVGCLMLFFIGGPLIAASLYFNAVGWLKGRLVNPDRAPLVAAITGFGLAVSLFAAVFTRVVRQACAGLLRGVGSPPPRWRHFGTGTRSTRSPVVRRIRYKPGVTYTYEVNGRRYSGDRLTVGVIVSASFPGLAGRTAAKYPVGGEVDVHYNPRSPGESVLRPRSVLHHLLWVVAAALFAFAWALATGRLR